MDKTGEISGRGGIKFQNLAITLILIFTLGNIFHMGSSPYCKTVMKNWVKEITDDVIIYPKKIYSRLSI